MAIFFLEFRGQSFAAELEAVIDVEHFGLVLKFVALRSLSQDNLPQDAAIAISWRLDLNLRGLEF